MKDYRAVPVWADQWAIEWGVDGERQVSAIGRFDTKAEADSAIEQRLKNEEEARDVLARRPPKRSYRRTLGR